MLVPFLLTEPWKSLIDSQGLCSEKETPALEPVNETHFPDRLHLFVWRNWELVNTERLAQVLGTTPDKVLEIGAAMGLPKKPHLSGDQLRRLYITVIRQNWHILPEDQLIELLGWDRGHYQYVLKEDDGLWIKLGMLKPRCQRLTYQPPSAVVRHKEAEIRELVQATFGQALKEPGEPAFEFIKGLSRRNHTFLREMTSNPQADEIDLSRNWTLTWPAEDSSVLSVLVEDFQAYLRAAMSCEIMIGNAITPTGGAVNFSLAPSVSEVPGSFEVLVEEHKINIVGRDAEGLRQALYFLEDQMEYCGGPFLKKGLVNRRTRLSPRFVYSYFALYGDPLMEEGIDPFPEGFLDKLVRVGVNGVWLQAVLRNLAPSKRYSEFGGGWETRLRNLSKLVERAKRYGVKVYLYINEPRTMPEEFFTQHPQIKGTHDSLQQGYFAMCTSTAEVRQWLSDSLAHVFSQVPELGGVFCITMSENLTNCFARGDVSACPRCSQRSSAEVVAEVIQTFRDGVRRSSAEADVIVWDWGWGNDWVRNGPEAEGVISKLPSDVSLLSVSEWDQPVNRGGFSTKVGEYSISVVGPGPRAKRSWGLAKQRGLHTLAKVQWNNTWEISAVPYVPVPNLIVEHSENLERCGIDGLMISWTVGGYPSPNFEVAKSYYSSPHPEGRNSLHDVAVRRYGAQAAAEVVQAWKQFSEAFVQFPYGVAIYVIPTQHGPANMLRISHTGYNAGMILFPYDDFKTWAGPYPVQVVEKQFLRMSSLQKHVAQGACYQTNCSSQGSGNRGDLLRAFQEHGQPVSIL
ncbi:MAG: hypothetical protein DMG06_07090 [Acidobacteria bacterium]|nr:MAG: hypothetical protein DMG06_07090 [Acidobacteriota bacterium]